MRFTSIRLITRDIHAMAAFYEQLTGQHAEWLAPVFAEIVTPSGTIALGAEQTVALFQEGSAEPAANRSAIIELLVDDVDAEYLRLHKLFDVVHPPKLMPWGNKTAQFRDPEGHLVSLYTPMTEAAQARFAGR